MLSRSTGRTLVESHLCLMDTQPAAHAAHWPRAVPSYNRAGFHSHLGHNIWSTREGAWTRALPYMGCIRAAGLSGVYGGNTLSWYSQGRLSVLERESAQETNPSWTFSPHHHQVSKAFSA